MEHQRLVSEFMSRTGGDSSTAKKVLEEHKWQLDTAVKSYRIVHTAALPPVGPRKNQEASQQAATGGATTRLLAGGSTVNGRSNVSPTGTLEHKSGERKLKRGLSKTTENVQLVTKARESVLHDISEGGGPEGGGPEDRPEEPRPPSQPAHFVDTPEYTFILPDLTRFPEDFRAFVHKDLIETATLVSLEQAGRLNWWADLGACSRLLPLATTGDGNCLLHAASLGMWGFHDRQLTLRRALYNALGSGVVKGSFYRRWRWQQTQMNKQSGLILSESEWQAEWNGMLKLASTIPRTHPGSHTSCCDSPSTKGLMERQERDPPAQNEDSEVFYESLEEFHVFVLAHVLRRPIIVVADTVLKNCDGEALAPIPFGGVYLPLECRPQDCHRSPLTLTYDAAHFSALVPMEDGASTTGANHTAAIPVVDPELNLLPIHFLVDPEPGFVWGRDEGSKEKVQALELTTEATLSLVKTFLDLTKVSLSASTSTDGGSDNSSENGSRQRSNSWSGPKGPLYRSTSVESTESGTSHGSGHSNSHSSGPNSHHGSNNSTLAVRNHSNESATSKKNKKKDKERPKANSKQMQNVVKSFGSLGKTMSKKLKNLGGLKGLGHKGDSNDDNSSSKKKVRKPSVGSATQSTKTSSSLTAELLKDRDHALCARLLHKRLDYQDKMVENYLEAARTNFAQDRERRRLQDEEILAAAAERRRKEEATQSAPSDCINPGCDGVGTPATCYLCRDCYARQRREAIDLENNSGGDSNKQADVLRSVKPGDNVRPASGSRTSSGGDFQRQNTLVNLGSSKFYTYADEDQSLPPPKYYSDMSNNMLKSSNNALNNYSASSHNKVDKAPLELSRSSFYDQPLSSSNSSISSGRNKLNKGAVIINNLLDDNSHYDNIVNERIVHEPVPQNHYSPKVSNTQPAPKVSPQCPTTGRYVSRITVETPSSRSPPQACRNQRCTGLGSEVTDYYCDNCYRLYDRDRTTFL